MCLISRAPLAGATRKYPARTTPTQLRAFQTTQVYSSRMPIVLGLRSKHFQLYKQDAQLQTKRRKYGIYTETQKGPLVATAWRDKKTIHLLSTADDPGAPAVQVERKRRDGTRNNVSCPMVVREYNAHMNGVDHADQLRSEHATYRTSKKWWHYVFWFLVDLAVANAFILFRESPHHQRQTKTGRRKPWRQVEFRQALSKQLIGRVRTSRKRKLLTEAEAVNIYIIYSTYEHITATSQ